MEIEEIEEKLKQLNYLESEYDGFEAIFNNNILKEDQSEINVNYFAQEMIITLEKMLELIKAFKGSITKEELKDYSCLRKEYRISDKKYILKSIKELKDEYDGYAAIFNYILVEDQSEINVKYVAVEMIKTLKKMIIQIGILREQNFAPEEKMKFDSLRDKDNGER